MVLDEQRRGILSEAVYDVNMQANKAANTVQNLNSCSDSTHRCRVATTTTSVLTVVEPFSLKLFSRSRREPLGQMRREMGYLRSISENVSINSTTVPSGASRMHEEINVGVTTPPVESEDPEKKVRITQLLLDRSDSQVDWK